MAFLRKFYEMEIEMNKELNKIVNNQKGINDKSFESNLIQFLFMPFKRRNF